MAHQAKKGGEYGANGEFYAGGQFVNSIAKNPKGTAATRRRATRKQETAPYTWEVPPADGLRSIFSLIAGTVATTNRQTGEMEVVAGFGDNPAWLDRWSGLTAERVADLVAKYNAGERWIAG